MRRGSAEALEVNAAEVLEQSSSHCLTRVLAAPMERVIALFLDPQFGMTWNSGAAKDRRVLNVCSNCELVLKESHRGVMLTTRISMVEDGACASMIRVRLSPQPPHDLAAIYELGIDDLWEERLYAITDALLGYSGGPAEQRDSSHPGQTVTTDPENMDR